MWSEEKHMNAEPNSQQRQTQMNCLGIAVATVAFLLVGAVLFSMIFSPHPFYNEKGNISKGVSNCRQIIMALKLYAADHDGKFPDAVLVAPKSSNEVFRVLFKEEVLDNENIFGCPLSPYSPDGNVGSDAGKLQALEAGENHWALTAGVGEENNSGDIPLVYENPVTATWPPKWNPDVKGTPTRGRAWSKGIVIGMNDGSVRTMPLASKKGKEVGLKPDRKTGKDAFENAIRPVEFPVGHVLDVE
jgi:hypothetical protein